MNKRSFLTKFSIFIVFGAFIIIDMFAQIQLPPKKVKPNTLYQVPVMKITYKPDNPTNFDKITFRAKCSKTGSIKKMIFFRKAVKVGEDNKPPWIYQGGPYPAGTFTFGAVAHDASGKVIVSKYTSVKVNLYDIKLAVTYSPSSPTNRDEVVFTASTPYQSLVKKMLFFRKAVKVGEDATIPWTHTGGPYAPGRFTFGAYAYDSSDNNLGSKYISVNVMAFPIELILSHSPVRPTSNDRITFSAQGSDTRDIKRVDFYIKAVKVGEDNTMPWTFVGGPYNAGLLTYGVIVYDDGGHVLASKYSSVRIQ